MIVRGLAWAAAVAVAIAALPSAAGTLSVYCTHDADACELAAKTFTRDTGMAKKKLAAPKCWSDLVKPEYRAEVELSNPVTSGAGYTILATLAALYGEDGAFDYLKRLNPNVVR